MRQGMPSSLSSGLARQGCKTSATGAYLFLPGYTQTHHSQRLLHSFRESVIQVPFALPPIQHRRAAFSQSSTGQGAPSFSKHLVLSARCSSSPTGFFLGSIRAHDARTQTRRCRTRLLVPPPLQRHCHSPSSRRVSDQSRSKLLPDAGSPRLQR
jgi:hypothetical protein